MIFTNRTVQLNISLTNINNHINQIITIMLVTSNGYLNTNTPNEYMHYSLMQKIILITVIKH